MKRFPVMLTRITVELMLVRGRAAKREAGRENCYRTVSHRSLIRLWDNHVARGLAMGGKTWLYKDFGGKKALFYYLNLQINFSFGGVVPMTP